jgi:hypothetical protein
MSVMPRKPKSFQSISGSRTDHCGFPKPEPRVMRYKLSDYEWTPSSRCCQTSRRVRVDRVEGQASALGIAADRPRLATHGGWAALRLPKSFLPSAARRSRRARIVQLCSYTLIRFHRRGRLRKQTSRAIDWESSKHGEKDGFGFTRREGCSSLPSAAIRIPVTA